MAGSAADPARGGQRPARCLLQTSAERPVRQDGAAEAVHDVTRLEQVVETAGVRAHVECLPFCLCDLRDPPGLCTAHCAAPGRRNFKP